MARPLRFVERRPRLAVALAFGLVVGCLDWIFEGPPLLRSFLNGWDGLVAKYEQTRLLRSFLIGWDVTVWTYVVLVGWLMARASHARIRKISEREDPSAIIVLVLLALGAVASLVALVAELAKAQDYWIAGFTLLGSWLMLNTLFSFHYAHMYFRAPPDVPPLRFPDDPPPSPDGWDFLYFAYTVAVAAQTSDVCVVTPSMRKAVLAQEVLVFTFNVAILGATVNVASGLLGSNQLKS